MKNRMLAVFLQELFITKYSLEIFVDIFFLPLINIVVFGYVSLYLSGSSNSIGAKYLLLGMILWQIIYVTQYSISVGSMWNIWSRNLSNVFISPVSVTEYVGAHTLSGLVKSCVLFIAIAIMSQYVFAFSVTSLGITNLILIFISLSLFSISTGILLLGLIFRYGTRIQALTWGLIFLFQPLTAAFFPVAVLPKWMQTISYAFPPTFVFEAARKNLETQNTQWELLIISFIENIVYFLITLLIFHYLFTKSKDSGQFARNES